MIVYSSLAPWGSEPILTDGFLMAPENAGINVAGGMMIRESLDPQSPFYAVLVSHSP